MCFLGRWLSYKLKVDPLSRLSSIRLFVRRPSVTDVLWLNGGLRLPLITIRKSHTGFQVTYKAMTLDDLEGS